VFRRVVAGVLVRVGTIRGRVAVTSINRNAAANIAETCFVDLWHLKRFAGWCSALAGYCCVVAVGNGVSVGAALDGDAIARVARAIWRNFSSLALRAVGLHHLAADFVRGAIRSVAASADTGAAETRCD
jgi:hypothetical protein